jgi:methylenetetrahydrofolate--tRNA-(uracil-5-)-methyltransferase
VNGRVVIVGGGLAGAEAAFQVATRGGHAVLLEMKPARRSPAHTLDTLAELVCSNSLKSNDTGTASGLLKAEMRRMGSLVLEVADETSVPAGGTLAVDREAFSVRMTERLKEAGVEIVPGEVTSIPDDSPVVIATGPLTSEAFAASINEHVGTENLYFYDAVAPIVYAESIDTEKTYMASRYDKGPADYMNCPMNTAEYEAFVAALIEADSVVPHEFENTPYFEGCMPIEALAERGPDTLMFGPMRPVGLIDPHTGRRPHAVVQLRRENTEGTLYNLVGFQTRLKFSEQKKVFAMIPGLESAEFARLGKLHRNTYIDSPRLITRFQRLSSEPRIFFAGQITGVEGYMESALSGLLAGINALRVATGTSPCVVPPPETISGALMRYISGDGAEEDSKHSFQPMNSNFGLLAAPEIRNKRERRAKQVELAIAGIDSWVNEFLQPKG